MALFMFIANGIKRMRFKRAPADQCLKFGPGAYQ